MRAEHLKYFLALADNHSLSKTAEEFFTTHQNVSKVIRQLEKEMNATLFARTAHGMMLTAEGTLLVPVARETMRLFRQVRLEIDHMSRRRDLCGELVLCGTPLATAAAMQPLIDDFCVLYPNVRYQVRDLSPLAILKLVQEKPEALGLLGVPHDAKRKTPLGPYLDEVTQFPLLRDEYLCLVGSHSPLAKCRTIPFSEFMRQPIAIFLSEGEDAASHPLSYILDASAGTAAALSTQNRQLYVQSIASGRFVGLSTRRTHALLSAFAAGELLLIPFAEDLSLDITLVTNRHPALDAVSQAFVDLVRERTEAQSF